MKRIYAFLFLFISLKGMEENNNPLLMQILSELQIIRQEQTEIKKDLGEIHRQRKTIAELLKSLFLKVNELHKGIHVVHENVVYGAQGVDELLEVWDAIEVDPKNPPLLLLTQNRSISCASASTSSDSENSKKGKGLFSLDDFTPQSDEKDSSSSSCPETGPFLEDQTPAVFETALQHSQEMLPSQEQTDASEKKSGMLATFAGYFKSSSEH